jgi:phage gp46-like protein
VIALPWDQSAQHCHPELGDDGALVADEGLDTLVMISFFTDVRVEDPAANGAPAEQKRGWWADAFREPGERPVGSKFWLLDFGKVTPATVRLAGDYATEALQWLIDDGIVARVEVRAVKLRQDAIGVEVTLYQPGDQSAPYRRLWEVTRDAVR